jgi:hypothetical protein
MKILSWSYAVSLLLSLWATSAQAMNRVAVDEVLKLNQAALGDEGILAYIKNKNATYDLSADDIVLLKHQGLSSAVLAAMLSSGPASPAPAPIPSPTVATAPVPSTIPTAPTVVPAPVLATSPTTPLPGLNADAAYFYQQLNPYGRWILADDNQWYWQPAVVQANPSWQPYADQGHWVYTDSGWYWASDYSWGWAPFHYGRWRLHPLHGWIWLPDRVWGPAWVSWRTGEDYCGWAPLPPGAYFDPAGVLVFRGRHVAIDFDFGLDWHHFIFCRTRDMGDVHFSPFRREHERRMAFGHTTIINHYTVNRVVVEGHNEVKVINHGIEPGRVATAKGHQIETVRIQELRTPAPNRAHERFDKNHKTLEVYRPHWGDPH